MNERIRIRCTIYVDDDDFTISRELPYNYNRDRIMYEFRQIAVKLSDLAEDLINKKGDEPWKSMNIHQKKNW